MRHEICLTQQEQKNRVNLVVLKIVRRKSKSFFEKVFINHEGEYLVYLPLKERIFGFLALILMCVLIVIITHLIFGQTYLQTPTNDLILIAAYASMFFSSIMASIPMFFRRLKQFKIHFVVLSFVVLMPLGFIFVAVGDLDTFYPEEIPKSMYLLWFVGVGSVIIIMRIYSHLLKTNLTQKINLETEINLAKNIQNKISPVVEIEFCDAKLFGKVVPAVEVGGDFIDAYHLSDKRLFVAIGDVSGHNLAAGLLMAITKGALRSELTHFQNLKNLMTSLNRIIYENSESTMFITFACALFDFKSHEVAIANAGHLPVLNIKGGKMLEENPAGIALGLTKSTYYEIKVQPLEKDDFWAFYTDGIVETMSPDGDEFGEQAFQKYLLENYKMNSQLSLFDRLLQKIDNFSGVKPHQDDVSFLGIEL